MYYPAVPSFRAISLIQLRGRKTDSERKLVLWSRRTRVTGGEGWKDSEISLAQGDSDMSDAESLCESEYERREVWFLFIEHSSSVVQQWSTDKTARTREISKPAFRTKNSQTTQQE